MGEKEALIWILHIDPDVKGIVLSEYANAPIMVDNQAYCSKGMMTKFYRIRFFGETLHVLLCGNGLQSFRNS